MPRLCHTVKQIVAKLHEAEVARARARLVPTSVGA